MADLLDSNDISDSQATYFENAETCNESQNFELVDTNSTQNINSAGISSQVPNSTSDSELKEITTVSIKLPEGTTVGDDLENQEQKHEKCKQQSEITLSPSIINTSKGVSLKRKAAIFEEHRSKMFRADSDVKEVNTKQHETSDRNETYDKVKIIPESEYIENSQNLEETIIQNSDNPLSKSSINAETDAKSTLDADLSENSNDSTVLFRSELSTYYQHVEPLNIESCVPNNETDKKSQEIELFMESSSVICNDVAFLNNSKINQSEKRESIESISVDDAVGDEHQSVTKLNAELLNDDNKSKDTVNVTNQFSAIANNNLNETEKINSNTSTKSRMSIEVIYDKADHKSNPKELVEINESGESIVLESSQNEKDLVRPVSVRSETAYNNSTNNSENIGNIKPTESSKDLFSNAVKLKGNNKGNTFTDNGVGIGSNDLFLKDKNDKPHIGITNEKSSNTAILSRNDYCTIVTLSDSESSLNDDYGKTKCLEDIKISQEREKIIQVEKEIIFNMKLKCLLSYEEHSKEICQKEVTNALCEPCNITQVLNHKATDSSTSTAGLADISASDNKDSSPVSVNSNPPLYQLQPSRLSFVSTISSSSSASSSVSLQKMLNKDNLFPQPHNFVKHRMKSANEFSLDEKQNWEIFEKFTKEWKNSRIILSAIMNFLNNECITHEINGSSDLLDNEHILPSSTPECTIKTEPTKKLFMKGSKKSRTGEKLTSLKTTNINNVTKSSTDANTPKLESKNITDSRLKKSNNFKSKAEISSVSELDIYFPDKHVFAKWSDNNYYPGIVSDILKTKFKVEFLDGKTKMLLSDFIIPIKGTLTKGCSVYVYISEDNYASSAMILDIEKGDEVIYTIETDEGKRVQTTIRDIFLTSDQAKLLKEQVVRDPDIFTPQRLSHVTVENVVTCQRRSKRITEVLQKSTLNNIKKNLDEDKPSISGVNTYFQGKDTDSDGKTSDSSQLINEENMNHLLGVQKEIVGTLTEQVIKGPLHKVKGKSRSRKKKDDPETINLLGPIPDAGSQIFKGISFVLSCVRPEIIDRYQLKRMSSDSNSEPGTENEDDWIKRPFVRDRLQAQIIAGGGEIFDSVEDIPPEKYKTTMHITNVPNLTEKSIFCLSVGIKSYNHQWIIRSCQQNAAIQAAEEELPAGWSFCKQNYIDTYQRRKNKPLEHTIVAIPILDSNQDFVKFWKKICENAGASVLILENSAQTFMEATVVVAYNKSCPLWVTQKANSWQIPILSTTWIAQCLIEGNLCSPENVNKYSDMLKTV